MENLRIKVGTRAILYTDLKSKPQVFDADFEAALATGRPRCLCNQFMPELYVARRRFYYLAKMPGTGHRHDPDCPFYETLEAHSGKAGYDGAFLEEEGHVDVKLSFKLSKLRASSPPTGTPSRKRGPSKQRGAAGLLGLLHFLWERSKNNMWFPTQHGREVKRRGWRNVIYHLALAIEQVTRGQAPLSESLFVVPAFDSAKVDAIEAEWAQQLAPVLDSASKSAVAAALPQHFKMLVGELTAIHRTEHGYGMTLKQTTKRLYMANDMHAKLLRDYAGEIAALGSDDWRVVFIAILSGTEKGYLTVLDAALMCTNTNYIPVDSDVERIVADNLIAGGRRFEKPLRYECDELTLPNFVLLDSESGRMPLEIFYGGGPKLDQRMAEKRRIYRESGEAYWEWDASKGGAMPALPAARKTPRPSA